jgi:predicted permease
MAREPVMTDSEWRSTVQVDGYYKKEGEDTNPSVNAVGPGYFATLAIPLLAGREFDGRDDAGAPKVAIVNEKFARYFFGQASPLGRRFGFSRGTSTDIEIVGLVRDGKATTLRDEIARFVYLPYRQRESLDQATFYVRTAQDEGVVAASVREAVSRADAQLPVFGLLTMSAQVSESLFIERMIAALSAAFGLLATLLAAVGLYDVMSFAVARRTREIGIRMALGAQRRRVLGLVMGEVTLVAGIGLAIGLPGSVALGMLLSSQLFGISPADPLTLGLATATLAGVALLAGFLPARRATLVDPMTALRYE